MKSLGTKVVDIALPMSSGQGVKYGTSWEMASENAVFLGNVAQSVIDLASSNSVSDVFKNIGNDIEALAVSGIAAGVKQTFLKSAGMIDAAEMKSGKRITTFQENLFKNVKFRSFDFKFRLIPRNSGELYSIFNIIKQFKLAAMPSVGSQGEGIKIFNVPNIFLIQYLIKNPDDDNQNLWLHRFQPAACDAIDIAYGGTDSKNYVSFNDPSHVGAPTYYDLSLHFTELAYITKESIDSGY